MTTASMRVRDVMTADPATIAPEAPLGVALATMRERQIRHLPVVEDTGRLVGILTDRDLRQATLARARSLQEAERDLTVQDAMSWAVVTIHPGDPLARAAAIMFERRVGSLPVVENARLVGILTERDLLRALMRAYPARDWDAEDLLW